MSEVHKFHDPDLEKIYHQIEYARLHRNEFSSEERRQIISELEKVLRVINDFIFQYSDKNKEKR